MPALRSGDPGTLAIALQGDKLEDADYTTIKQMFNYAFVKVGLRADNFPAAEEKALLLSHVKREYGKHTPAEVRLAFDMAITGRLDLKPEQVVCYENFSCLYFSTIMNAYRKWAAEEYKQIKQDAPVEMITETTGTDAMQDWWKEFVLRVKSGNCSYDFVPMLLVEWAEKKGMMTIAEAAHQDYLVKAMEYRFIQLRNAFIESQTYDDRKTVSEFGRMREEGCFTGPHVEYLQKLAKRIQLWELAKRSV